MARTLKSRITVAVVLLLIAAAQGRSQENPAGGVWADPATGLMWAAKDSRKDVNFKGAVKYCRDLRLAGHSDWRLADMAELQGIFDKAANAPGLAGEHDDVHTMWHVRGNLFLTGYHWANDQSKRSSGYHYYFDFNEGKSNDMPSGFMYPYSFMRALCVRGSGDPLGGQRQHP